MAMSLAECEKDYCYLIKRKNPHLPNCLLEVEVNAVSPEKKAVKVAIFSGDTIKNICWLLVDEYEVIDVIDYNRVIREGVKKARQRRKLSGLEALFFDWRD
jgi:hypothetical protein